MTDRTVAVRLLARVDGYKRNLVDAAAATKKFGSDAAAATKGVANGLAGMQAQSTIAGASLLGLAAVVVTTAATFDKSMSSVQAVTGATVSQMDALRDAAIKAGQATVYSASDAADAEAELAKAGITTSDILAGALTGSLSLAAAGQLNLADAATISAQAMNTFHLQGQDVTHIADVLAAGANKSAADVGQLGDALRQGGLVAQQTGLSLEDTVGALSAFADRALIGSDAGTSLKTMLQRLTPQSQQAADEMKLLGIHAYDAQGQFVGLAAFAQNLKDSLGKLTPEARNSALSIIFGTDAVRGASILYSLGAKGVNDYTSAVNDSGAANRMAATQLDNLAGDWEQLTGSVQTAFIQTGSSANGFLRGLTQTATGAVNVLGELPSPILATGFAVTAMGGAFLIAAPRIVAVNELLAASPGLARAASAGFASLGAVAGVATLATMAMWVKESNDDLERLKVQWAETVTTINSKGISSTAIDTLYQQITDLENQLDNPGLGDKFTRGAQAIEQKLEGIFGMDYTTNYDQQISQLQGLQAEYEKYKTVVNRVAGDLGTNVGRAIDLVNNSGVKFSGNVADIVTGVEAYSHASAAGSVASHNAADAMNVLADATSSVDDRLKALKQQWDSTTGAMLGTSDATIAAERALDDMSKSIKDNGNVWKTSTDQGRANQSQVNDSIRAFESLRETMIQNGSSVHHANAVMAGYLTQLRDRLPAGAKTARAEIDALIKKYNAIPAKKSTTLTADTSQAQQALRNLANQIAALRTHIAIQVTSSGTIQGTGGGRTIGETRASGGRITGPGTATSDSILIAASNGEYVVQASSVDKYGPDTLDAINSGTAVIEAFAGGGHVKKKTTSRVPGRVGRRSFDFGNRSDIASSAAGWGPLVGAFDFTAYGTAVDRATQATQALLDARVKVNEASTPQEEAQAQHDLAAATMEVANAEKAKVAAKPTGANIEATFAHKAARLDRMRRNLKILAQRGLSPVILKEILDAGLDQGYDMAAALVADPSVIPSLNRTQAAITSDANSIAGMFGGVDRAAVASAVGGGSASSASSGTSTSAAVQTVKVQLEMTVKGKSGETVWHDVLTYGRGRGGNLPTLGAFTIKLK